MNNRGGFTIVELIIVITVMAILLIIGVVNLRSSQIQARDDERKTDIENIARGLESYYSGAKGNYPGTTSAANEAVLKATDIDPKSLRTPGISDGNPMSLVIAQNAVEAEDTVVPKPTVQTYVYQPIATDGSLCTADTCRRFNLYYLQETTNKVIRLKSVRQ